METTSLLFALLRHTVCGEGLNDETKCACTPQNLERVYLLARKHDLAHLVAHSVESLEIEECEVLNKLSKAKSTAIFRYAKLDYEFGRICNILECSEIPFMPLKGSVLRPLYPDPWMRNSCDIDVLVKPEDLWTAVTTLERQGYRRKGKSQQDVSLYAPSGVHLELHYSLTGENDTEAIKNNLAAVWDCAELKSGTKFQYLMQDSSFYLYHISHMSSHFLRGGCGIRTVMDIWILNHRIPENSADRNTLLALCGLLAFAEASKKLSEYWFSNIPQNEEIILFGSFVLKGGIYGNRHSGAVIQKAASTKLRIPFHRIVIPFKDLRYAYPILDKMPWLMPICQVLRWFRLAGILLDLMRKRMAARLVSRREELDVQQMLQYLQLP